MLGAEARRVALSFAETLLPAGRILPGAGDRAVDRLEQVLSPFGPDAIRGYGAALRGLELAPLLSHRRPFSRLGREGREAVLDGWLHGGPAKRAHLLFLSVPLKTAHFDDPEVYRRFGCVYGQAPRAEVTPRWRQQVQAGRDLAGETLECDVVVVGTGAGGAVVAKELAQAGLAVVMLEEGRYHGREELSGRSSEMIGKLYRNAGATYSVGNTIIPIPLGRAVGGTTMINSGTCFRTPDWVLARWRDELGLTELTPEHLAPYFEKVERELGVAPAPKQYLGGAARVVARGADRLGWSHHPLLRNAPECDGQGVCVFGCPTDAKRSTNVSYVPKALLASAIVVTEATARRVIVEGGRAAGVEADVGGGRLVVRARRVVLACGTLLTPLLLMEQGLLAGSSALGGNLTIHPALAMSAVFDQESIRGWEAIPQGYCVDQFHKDGILMEGSSLGLEGGAATFNVVGRRLVELMEAYDRVATFGAMISEQASRGRVRLGPGKRPVTTYWLKDHDLRRLKRAIVLMGRMFFAAGATSLLPPVRGYRELRSLAELEALGEAPLTAADLMLTAYHPLGTCRIGPDPKTSVLGPDHQAHELPGLYVTDGSAVPTSPAVNPQVTIMALAARAADRIAASLS